MHASFDCFRLDCTRRQLLRSDEPVHLSPKAFLLLEALVAAAPRALTRDELHDAIWPQTYVEESSLAGLVTEVRSALADPARKPRFIRTVHGFGYAFCSVVSKESPHEPVASVIFRGENLPLYEGDNILGRDATASVQIDDQTVSRRHACIRVHGSEVVLQDLESKNGTLLDGAAITGSAAIHDGQTIILGDARLVFSSSGRSGSTVTIHGKTPAPADEGNAGDPLIIKTSLDEADLQVEIVQIKGHPFPDSEP